MRTVKLRPDQPLFKADAFHMPVGVHASFEIVRGIVKWGTASLHKDNPHNNQLPQCDVHAGCASRASQRVLDGPCGCGSGQVEDHSSALVGCVPILMRD